MQQVHYLGDVLWAYMTTLGHKILQMRLKNSYNWSILDALSYDYPFLELGE